MLLNRDPGTECWHALAGYPIADVKSAGYVEGLKAAGYTLTEANAAGYTLAEVKTAGYIEGIKAAGYTCAECKAGWLLL